MSTGKTWQIKSTSSEQTEQLAERLGQKLRGGEVIELKSDLGGGKTTFIRGLARGFGSKDRVGSPSFTLGREYKVGSRTMRHFDLYRLTEPGLMVEELAEAINDKQSVTVVEWGDVAQNVLPEDRLTIEITPTGDEARMFALHYPLGLQYLVEGLQP